jgi:thioredoxin-like negative regulator of GroEL
MPSRLDTDPLELTDRDFAVTLARSAEPVVVEFHFAGWERPWRALGSEDWRELRREFGQRVFCATLETGAQRAAATRFGAEVVPEVLIFLEGQVVARFSGRTRAAEVSVALADALRRWRERAEASAELAVAVLPAQRETPVRSVRPCRSDEERETRVMPRMLARAG